MIQPDLIYSVLCDDVRREDNGKWILLGLFEDLLVPSLPFAILKCCIVNKWSNGQGNFTQQSRFVDEGGKVLLQSEEVKVDLADAGANFTAVQVFGGLAFEKTGPIWVEILLNGQVKSRYAIRVGMAPS